MGGEVGCHADVINDPAVGDIVPPRDDAMLADALLRRLRSGFTRDETRRLWQPVFDGLKYQELARSLAEHVHRLAGAKDAKKLIAARARERTATIVNSNDIG